MDPSLDNLRETPARPRPTFMEDFRRFFQRGLATLLPTLITVLLLFKIWEILWSYLGQYIIWLLKWITAKVRGSPGGIGYAQWLWDIRLPAPLVQLIGVALAILAVYIVGLFVGNIIGRTSWRLIEGAVMRIPLIRAIYPAVKQVTDFVLSERKAHLQGAHVVAVRPHHDNIWSVGLVTGPGIKTLSDAVGSEMVTVFVPSSPTAFSGYVLVVPRDRVVELPLTVEDAMRLLVTGGVSQPSERQHLIPEAAPPAAAPAAGAASSPAAAVLPDAG